ncbi:TBC-domain-containing protein [Flagelloscypha sp. PMI_526]|nr:TBC-domain-containing protein [Flagelloscypha sp. PMI_526]
MADQTARAFRRILDNAGSVRLSADDATKKLRRMILVDGIPTSVDPTLRPRIWKILLKVNEIDADEYLEYVSRGPPEVREKIRNDTHRTLKKDFDFHERVSETMIIRLLDAFEWRCRDREGFQSLDFSYVQGMNVLSAPFLYTLPSEIEAFYCFSKFIEEACPLYVQPTLEGVHRGLNLLDRCLRIVDEELFTYLRKKKVSAEIYAFASTMTLCANTRPLDQVLQLWDFLLAFGVHLNILCVIAQLFLMRDDLMTSKSPGTLLYKFPPFNAVDVIGIAVTLVRDLPADLYDELVRHPFERPPLAR